MKKQYKSVWKEALNNYNQNEEKEILLLQTLEKGDKVYTDKQPGYMNFNQFGIDTVKKVTFKYDENTGEKYKVIHLKDNHLFDSRTGNAITEPLSYYIRKKERRNR